MRNRNSSLARKTALLFLSAFVAGLTFVAISGCTRQAQDSWKSKYPPARMAEVIDNYHGTLVSDPYRWLEDPESEETRAWVAAQNKLTAEFVNTPAKEKIKRRLLEIWDFPTSSSPTAIGGRYFVWKNSGLQNQAILYVQDSLKGEPRIVLDPNLLSPDGTISVSDHALSKDGRYLAYALSESGSDWQTIHIREVDTGRDLDEKLQWCKFTSMAWKNDNLGFYYTRYPEPGMVAPEDAYNYNRVYWHALGTPQAADQLIFELPEEKELAFAPIVSDDGRYLILSVWHGTDIENRIFYRPIESPGEFIRLLNLADASYEFIDNTDSLFYFKTNKNAPFERLIAIDITAPEPENWKEIIPENSDILEQVLIVGDKIVALYLHDASARLLVFASDGRLGRELNLPTMGTVYDLQGRRTQTELFYTFSSYLYPPTTFRCDITDLHQEVIWQSAVKFDPNLYETKQVMCTSRDGTRIPLFITHKKGLKLNGRNPALLYGYGGFAGTTTPYFSRRDVLWLEIGGVYAEAVLRGGNEYGEAWHRAGMLEKKQNVFDDFIACAEWLIDNRYTNPAHLVIEGGSNGGLLVAACMVQRPDLFGAVLCEVPVIDMLRYHRFSIGEFWSGEYGNAEENPEHFKFLYAYSPLHNLKTGTAYPPVLITTAESDDRVLPAHSKKFAAALQAADAGRNPILLRVETRAGHGAGKPTEKKIEEISVQFAFLFRVLRINPDYR